MNQFKTYLIGLIIGVVMSVIYIYTNYWTYLLISLPLSLGCWIMIKERKYIDRSEGLEKEINNIEKSIEEFFKEIDKEKKNE